MAPNNLPGNGEKPDKKTAIIKAALKAYAKYGIAHATTRQIADMAGIGKSTVFEYFASKEELLDEAFMFLSAGMMEGYQSMHTLSEKDPAAAMNACFDNAIHTAMDDPGVLMLISQYSLGALLKADDFEEAKETYNRKMHTVMQSLMDEFHFLIAKGIEKGVFHLSDGMDVEGLVYNIGALIREIQAQAFLQNKYELLNTCTVVKKTAMKLLGVNNTPA